MAARHERRPRCGNCWFYSSVSAFYQGGDWWCTNEESPFHDRIRRPDTMCDCHEFYIDAIKRQEKEQ